MSTTTENKNFDEAIMKIYGWSEKKNFRAVSALPEKHPFCITPHHIDSAQKYGGMLGSDAIRDAEKLGHGCGISDCRMSYDDHKHGIVIQCLQDPKGNKTLQKECEKYMKKVIKMKHFKTNGYIGVVLLEGWK